MPPSAVNYTYLAQINYAFYTPDSKGYLSPDTSNGSALLQDVVTNAHAVNTQVILTIGGASGSTNFSTVLASTTATKTLVSQCVSLVKQYDLDGIDLDYESPTNLAETNNAIKFLKSLRSSLKKISNKRTSTGHPLLTSLLSSVTFVGDDGSMLSNLKNVSDQVDHFNLDTYDYNLSGNTTAPNSPIFAVQCSQLLAKQNACVNDSITSYLAAEVPRSKMRVGVPFYSKQAVAASAPYDGMTCYPKVAAGNYESDIVYADSVSQQQGANWTYGWDSTTKTGWAYNSYSGMFSATNWAESVEAKAEYTSCQGLAGLSIWSIDDDVDGELTAVAAGVKTKLSNSTCKGLGYA
ncbi:hypothetical protein H2203_006024 [Taxawa tesnikishii (nom. ined.)]|nr:hypothetical protein H2203_006024 [Dothideales sp. JES 119]